MKKEYVKPQNRVVYLSGKLMDEVISFNPEPGDDFAKEHFDDDSDDSSSDVWED